MKKLLVIIGARPQFIKFAPLSKAFQNFGSIDVIIIHTGQHYDSNMSSLFFSEMDIHEPHYNLDVKSGSHADQTAMIMQRLETIIAKEDPDGVVVFGDTNSTLSGALVAVKMNIPVFHVEAGLRSFNRKMPEEINRVITDHISVLHFAPTATAVQNLKHEGITDNVYHVGDVMYDAALQFSRKAEIESFILKNLNLSSKQYFLATIHRAENTDNSTLLMNILQFLKHCSMRFPVVLPLHPRTRKMIKEYQLESYCEGIKILDPVGFLDMVRLESNAACVITDSGGVQKEAYFHKVPCITTRKETEWAETVESKWNKLLPPYSLNIEDSLDTIFEFINIQDRGIIQDYGDGTSSQKIAHIISRYFGLDNG